MKRAAVGLAVTSFALVGCGAGSPLLHPAQHLGTGDVRAAIGLSGQGIAAGVSQSLGSAEAISVAKGDETSPEYAKGAMVLAALAPGIAPYAGARVGLGKQWEGGVAYTGRAARIDGRRAFVFGSWAVSIGAGFQGTFAGGSSSVKLDNVDIGSLRGFGFDVPVLVGWRSAGGLYQWWAGARGGYAHHFIASVTSVPQPGGPLSLDADQMHVGGVVGIATGFRHIHVALELETAFQHLEGKLGGVKGSIDGISLTPASAVWIDF